MDSIDIKQEAKRVAKVLGEKSRRAKEQIQRLIEQTDLTFVEKKLEDTERIEADGGMLTKNEKRRRTKGGVFFYLSKQDLTPEQQAIVFPPVDWKARKAAKKAKKAAQAEAEAKAKTEQGEDSADSAPDTEKPKQDDKPAETKTVSSPHSDLPADVAEKLAKLETAAETLRERLATMEASGQKGISMTRTLLKNTERQISALLSEHKMS